MTVVGVLCGADDFVAIARFAQNKKDWFAKFLDLSNGIPSHDRINVVLAGIKPDEFEKCFLSWITALQQATQGKVIAVDGKTLRGSFDRADEKSAIHMVSAWSAEHQLSLGQLRTQAKSNEITAIPKLLEMLEIAGCFVTIDAMGCQTEIARKIVEAGGDYCLAVKDNQPTLHQGIVAAFSEWMEADFADVRVSRHLTSETAHGRHDHRTYLVCPIPADLPDRDRWPGIKAIGVSLTKSTNVLSGKVSEGHMRYYILSKYISAKRFGGMVRGHWNIENQLHWQLDVAFREDHSRVRTGHADENLSRVRRLALALLKHDKTAKLGVKNKRLCAGWDDDYRTKVLLGQ